MFLFRESPSESPDKLASILSVDKASGSFGPQPEAKNLCRFFFYKPTATKPVPKSGESVLVNGDEVKWFYYTEYPDKSVNNPRQAYYNKSTKDFRFETENVNLAVINGYEAAKFHIEFV